MKRYVFHVVTKDGTEIRWPGLTLHQAERMAKWTTESAPLDVVRWGWEEMQ